MLVPCVDMKEFEKFGFKKCRGFGDVKGMYLCVSRGVSMIFVSPLVYAINPWTRDDSRIHKRPNCRYRDRRDALDITYQLIKEGMLKYDGEDNRSERE